MKHLLIISFISLFSLTAFSQEKSTSNITTYYFVRHAEKETSNPAEQNPHLTETGLKRAENWSAILGNFTFDAVYSTDYYRTIETATPTATKNNLEITIYDPRSIDYAETFLKDTKGKTVLVVGHSNTTPAFVNAIIQEKKYKNLDEKIYGNLYIVTIIDDKISDTLLSIN